MTTSCIKIKGKRRRTTIAFEGESEKEGRKREGEIVHRKEERRGWGVEGRADRRVEECEVEEEEEGKVVESAPFRSMSR